MQRRFLLASILASLLLAAPAWASDRVDRILRDLQREGFTQINISRTLLGRTRIVASGPDGTREIVVHPGTGEVLRDIYSGDDSRDPDENDDTDDDDNSGHGHGGDDGDDGEGDDGGGDDNGNSGHGGDNGGGGDDGDD